MKNPWMSAWLSAANTIGGAARSQFMAEMSKAQTQIIRDWQRAWMQAWLEAWSPTKPAQKRRK